MNKIAITTSSFGKYNKKPLELLEEKGFDILMNSYGRTLVEGEILALYRDAIGVIAGTEKIGKDIMAQLNGLKVISRCGTGLDNVDLDTAKKLGIKVFNTPDSPTISVAELTVSLILSLLRKVNIMDRGIRNIKWEKQMGNLIYKKNIGIVGFGRIGRKLAELLKSFNCVIKYTDPFLEDNIMGFEKLPLEKLLSWADIVSLHVSSTEEMIGKREVRLMKKGAWLINVSRGSVVNEDALYHAINSGRLSGAALDVFKEEPYRGILTELNNVILTPHIGSYAVESRVEMEMEAANNLLKGLGLQ